MSSSDVLGFVVVEYNQASRRPGLPSSELHRTERDAQDELDACVEDTAASGRRETYKLAQVVLLGDED
jgi:hypothetical protein